MDQYQKLPQGSVLGGVLLVSGCCIGAGMLGLPVMSSLAGLQPTVVMFILSWLFMTCTAFLLLEVTLWFSEDVNIVTMASRTLGNVGKVVAWSVFLFLFYSLLVAYVTGSGTLFAHFMERAFASTVASWIGSLFFSVILGLALYFGVKTVDQLNRLFMYGLIASYVALVIIGSAYVDPILLQYHDWSKSALMVPVMIISFGYHNLIPSLATYLHRDVKRLKQTFFIGGLIPLAVYLVWECLILGLVPLEGQGGFREALDHGQMATHTLSAVTGIRSVSDIAQAFAFFAIVTSFVGVALSFFDFLADGMKIKKDAFGKILLCILVLLPPFIFALIYPEMFLVALNYAGGIGAVILFGILPAAMVWAGRYYHKMGTTPLVPGGKVLLFVIICISVAIMALQIAQEIL